MARHVVAKVSELGPGQRILVDIGGRPIAVFNVGGEYFAVLNRCPHQGASLFHGRLTSAITSSEPGEYVCTHAGEILRCPWHGWEFHLRTGESWVDPEKTRVRTYKTCVADGGDLMQEPLKAETFPIFVDDQYLVVEV